MNTVHASAQVTQVHSSTHTHTRIPVNNSFTKLNHIIPKAIRKLEEQNKLYKSRVTYNKWKQVQQSQNTYSHLSQPKVYHNKGEGFKTSSRMPSRGTVVIPRGYPQRQPHPVKGSRDITNKSNKMV